MVTVNITVGMTPEMLEDVDREADNADMSRAEYIRHCIRQAEDSPFDTPEKTLGELADDQKGAA
ncbi:MULTISPECIES: CopG family transcriptional regulator [Salinibaculum]|uniref:CopG family transcriptional regulator n=1 Tax=Salinibaculum TaxID=2732368 RepID=UPI0030D29A9A